MWLGANRCTELRPDLAQWHHIKKIESKDRLNFKAETTEMSLVLSEF